MSPRLDPFTRRDGVQRCTRFVPAHRFPPLSSVENPCKSAEPTRGFEPRTPSLRVTAKEGSQPPSVAPGSIDKPNWRTPKDSEEPGNP